MERDDALAMLATETDADAGARARVDAASIQRSADDINVTTYVEAPGESVGDTRLDPVVRSVSTTNTVAMYQGSGSVPGDGPDADELRDDNAAGTADDGRMTLTATRTGNTVTLTATADNNPSDIVPAAVLIDIDDAVAGADGMTSHMEMVDLPGGVTKHIFLMSDIEAPLSGAFGANVPTGLGTVGFDEDSQTARYPIANNVVVDTDNQRADTPLAAGTATGAINTADNPAIDIDLGASFTPSAAVPTVEVQRSASFDGTYAGVPGSYICNADAGANCAIYLSVDSELVLGPPAAAGGVRTAGDADLWTFSPAGPTRYVADGDYLIYGAWLKRPDSALGTGASAGISAGSNLFDAFAAGEATNDEDNIHLLELTGKASYSGSAAGFFADRRVGVDAAVSGTFTADATLSADFGTAAVGGTISGTITDFVRDDGVATDWTVGLGMLDFSAETGANLADGNADFDGMDGLTNTGVTSTSVAGAFTPGTTSGTASGASWAGEWGVQLVGAGPTGATSLQHPTGVVGTFGAAGGSPEKLATGDAGFVGVIGGFGARKD
jgi:hypothetical protein